MRPQKVIDATQAWFWQDAWQAGEREAAREIASGGGEVFESGAEPTSSRHSIATPSLRRAVG